MNHHHVPRRTVTRRRRATVCRRLAGLLLAAAVGLAITAYPQAVWAAAPTPPPATDSIAQVIMNVRAWLMGILAAWATLCLTIAFLRLSSGEQEEVERGKRGVRNAVLGYAGALLTPLLLTIVSTWVA